MPRNARIPANADPAFFDLGLCGPNRAAPGGDEALCGAFKVPTLRNVGKRVALMHNGFFTQLRDAVAFLGTLSDGYGTSLAAAVQSPRPLRRGATATARR